MTEFHGAAGSWPAAAYAPQPLLRADPQLRAVRHRNVAEARTSWFDVDAAVAFALFATSLYIPQLGTAGGALFALIFVGYAGLRAKKLLAILGPRILALSVPIVAVASFLWSEQPDITLKYSLEFLITALSALLLSAAERPKAVLQGIFLALALYVITSLGLGQSVKMGNAGDTAFAGLNDSKNMLADIASAGFLVSVAVFCAGIADRKYLSSALAIMAGLTEAYTIVQARSAGAILGLAAGLPIFLFFLSVCRASNFIRVSALTILGFVLASAATAYLVFSDEIVAMGEKLFNKDSTLTGRAYLWQRADDLIAEKPVFGKGFHAFWVQGNPDAEGLWRYLGIRSEMGFNFHNTFVEVQIHLGWIGLIALSIVLLFAFFCLLRKLIRRPTLPFCFWMGLFVYQTIRMPLEAIGTTEFYFSTILLFAALGVAFTPVRSAKRRRRYPPVSSADFQQQFGPQPVTAVLGR